MEVRLPLMVSRADGKDTHGMGGVWRSVSYSVRGEMVMKIDLTGKWNCKTVEAFNIENPIQMFMMSCPVLTLFAVSCTA